VPPYVDIEADIHSPILTLPPSFPPSLLPSLLQIVALAMPNTLAFPLGFLGTAWGGAATAPLNPDYKEEEFRFYLEVGREGGREGGVDGVEGGLEEQEGEGGRDRSSRTGKVCALVMNLINEFRVPFNLIIVKVLLC